MNEGEIDSHQNEVKLLIDKREEDTYYENWQNVNLFGLYKDWLFLCSLGCCQ